MSNITQINTNEMRLSVSKVSTFADCKAKFNFNYNLRLPKKTWEHHTLGKLVHKVLEDFHLEYLNGCKDTFNVVISRSFKSAYEEYKADVTPDMFKEARSMIDEYLKLTYKTGLPNVLSCERQFSFPVADNVVVNGAIDRIQIDPDGIIHVCDYKTAAKKKYLVDKFFQLETYAYVVYLENPDVKFVRASYIMIRHGYEYITRDIDVDIIKQIPQKFVDYANAIVAEKEFKAHPTPLCDYCDFQAICPKSFKKYDPTDVNAKMKAW